MVTLREIISNAGTHHSTGNGVIQLSINGVILSINGVAAVNHSTFNGVTELSINGVTAVSLTQLSINGFTAVTNSTVNGVTSHWSRCVACPLKGY